MAFRCNGVGGGRGPKKMTRVDVLVSLVKTLNGIGNPIRAPHNSAIEPQTYLCLAASFSFLVLVLEHAKTVGVRTWKTPGCKKQDIPYHTYQ
jgi:hypothetical protein